MTVIAFTNHIRAGFEPDDYDVFVKVGDVEFGSFDEIEGIDGKRSNSHKKVILQRNFVTEPSLYLWARDVAEEHQGPKNIEIIYRDQEGSEISKFTLGSSQPLAWTVEAADPSLGGFHERIEIAVQEVIEH